MIEKSAMQNNWSRLFGIGSLFSLGATIVVAVGFSIAGELSGEPWRANFAFALLIMSPLTALAVVMSYGASPKVMQVARAAWFVVAVVGLVFAQYILSLAASDAQTAAGSVLVLIMLILTFPAGYIAIGFIMLYSFVMPGRAMGQLDVVIFWSVFAVVGYLQWFKLLPYLIKKWRNRRSQA